MRKGCSITSTLPPPLLLSNGLPAAKPGANKPGANKPTMLTRHSLAPHFYAIALLNLKKAPGTRGFDFSVRRHTANVLQREGDGAQEPLC